LNWSLAVEGIKLILHFRSHSVPQQSQLLKLTKVIIRARHNMAVALVN